jgi:uncharacterized protein
MIAARAPFLALLMCWAFTAFSVPVFSDPALADVAVPPLSGRVVDQTGTLSSDIMASLTQVLRGLELRKGSQVAVLIVPTTAPETIEQYSIRVAEAWKIGRRKIDDGALLVVAKDDHKLRIEVGYGLEGALTDVTSRRIIDEIIVPRFKAGDFSGGISAGVDRMIGVIDGEPLPVPKPEVSHNNNNDDTWLNLIFSPFGLLGYAAVAGIMRHLLGRLLGSGATAGVVGVFIWFVLGSIALSSILGVAAFFLTMFGDSILTASQNASRSSGRGGGSGWSGGGGGWSGGGSSSSSSDSGGFSGGGGSFGGGGASGSW